ncbi:MAG: thiamine phosphate synthase [Leptospirales bacterium]|nr:thiamine phosphate synthase [Leptospirales bacterium]
MKEIYSSLDANINRCIEGLRVCEDIFRFGLKNIFSAEFKNLRHSATEIISSIPIDLLLTGRDVSHDEQKFINTSGEMKRENIKDIFRSNIHRAIEASRVIEEISKSINTNVSERFQQIRFTLYDLEKKGWFIIEKTDLMSKFHYSLYAIIDSGYVPIDQMEDTSKILIDSGAEIIQLRIKNISDKVFLSIAEKISKVCKDNSALFIVNDRADIAILSEAGGVHLGQDDIPMQRAKSILGEKFITGISVSNIDEAGRDDADYIAVGPVFQTASKFAEDGNRLDCVDINVVKEICNSTGKPVAAIGGVSESNIGILADAGILSFAVISALFKDGKVSENTKRLINVIKSYREL